MNSVTIHEAKTTLSKLVTKVEAGGEFVICRGKQPVARLTPYFETRATRPKVGTITSQPVSMTSDCFTPMNDVELDEWTAS
jgi:antitoxin (DNA-binding transcriptional repressor) of toxin-antitoxin stability system